MSGQICEFSPDDLDILYRLESECNDSDLKLEYYQLLKIVQHHDTVTYTVRNDKKEIIGSFYIKVEKFLNQLWILGINISEEYRRMGNGRLVMETINTIAKHLYIPSIIVCGDRGSSYITQHHTC